MTLASARLRYDRSTSAALLAATTPAELDTYNQASSLYNVRSREDFGAMLDVIETGMERDLANRNYLDTLHRSEGAADRDEQIAVAIAACETADQKYLEAHERFNKMP